MKQIFVFLFFVSSTMMAISAAWPQQAVSDKEFRQYLEQHGGKPTNEFNQYVKSVRQQELLQQLQYYQAQQQLQQAQQQTPYPQENRDSNTFWVNEQSRTDFMRSLNTHRANMTEIYRRPYK